jgi:hypothetical protein
MNYKQIHENAVVKYEFYWYPLIRHDTSQKNINKLVNVRLQWRGLHSNGLSCPVVGFSSSNVEKSRSITLLHSWRRLSIPNVHFIRFSQSPYQGLFISRARSTRDTYFLSLPSFSLLKESISKCYLAIVHLVPTTVAAQSRHVLSSRSNTAIVGSNSTWSMDVCVPLCCVYVVLCIGSGLATGWSPSKESYRLAKV